MMQRQIAALHDAATKEAALHKPATEGTSHMIEGDDHAEHCSTISAATMHNSHPLNTPPRGMHGSAVRRNKVCVNAKHKTATENTNGQAATAE